MASQLSYSPFTRRLYRSPSAETRCSDYSAFYELDDDSRPRRRSPSISPNTLPTYRREKVPYLKSSRRVNLSQSASELRGSHLATASPRSMMAHLKKTPTAVSPNNRRKKSAGPKKVTNNKKCSNELASKKRNQPHRGMSGPAAKRTKTQTASSMDELQNKMAAPTALENAKRGVSILSSGETFDLTHDESSDTEADVPLAVDPRLQQARSSQKLPYTEQPAWDFQGLETSTTSSSSNTGAHSSATLPTSLAPTLSPNVIRRNDTQGRLEAKADAAQETRIAALQAQIDRLEHEHEAEIQQLRRAKDSEAATFGALQQGMELKLADAEMQSAKQDNELKALQVATSAESGKLRNMLEEEKQKSGALKKERDDVSEKLVKEKQISATLVQERDKLFEKLKAAENAASEIESLRSEKMALGITIEDLNEEVENDRNDAEALRAQLSVANTALNELEAFKIANGDLTAQLQAVKTANADLTAHLETCKAAIEGQTPSEPAVASPSIRSESHSVASNEQTKLDNVRKMYTQVKSRYDNLYSIIKNLSSTTRDMPLAGFGEFGGYLTQLKKIVNEAEKPRMLLNGGRGGN